MGKMDSLLLRSKFRGSMLGALMGDCLGSAYEGEEIFTAGMKLVIQRSFDKLEGPHFRAPVIQFTDDSAMTYAVAESLIERQGFDQKDMAKKFVKSFYKEPNRGYGAGVTTVFQKLRNNKFIDVLGPAREQFNGEGSLGNGGAMRVAPVALFCHKNYQLMVDVARKQSQITHTHKTGVDGAILQAIAIHKSLLLDPKEILDTCKFTDDLIKKMDEIEVDEEGLGLVNPSPYKTQLKLVRDLICEDGDGPHDEKVVHHLGNDILALHSVPTAIYCFLRAQRPIKDVQTENPLRRTIQYALPDTNWSTDAGVQFILSSDSLLSDRSSSTIVCGNKRSDYTSTSVKSVTECGVQWDGLDSEKQSSSVSCNTSSVGNETRDSAVAVEYDEHDIFAQTIACYLRVMDIETARQAQIEIRKVIHDHRLHKPETQSIRLLRPEISEKSTMQKALPGIEKSHRVVVTTRPIKRTSNYLPRSSREIQHTARFNKNLWPNNTVLSKSRQLKSMVKKPSLIIEPVITHYKCRTSTSTSVKPATIDKSIGLGGDTDTIGSMAGSIAGAFYGEELIRQEILNHCEFSSQFRSLADQLFDSACA